MSPLLLHHYPDSAFSEKARLMLGFKGLPWTSVRIPEVLPKPDVMALTGGYRKTPLLQLGADRCCRVRTSSPCGGWTLARARSSCIFPASASRWRRWAEPRAARPPLTLPLGEAGARSA
jgi:hypothetical protein